ncbi:hypothetical protein JQ617_08015 [Bradyrhizobium sp. KB893862 SZCCT0404]|uniref:hypothetical protein n=1 Tax=Bradyrhizobium sp. KB893862 SZCCT0404 TaxID=2807672 RepID=UPI001BA6ED9C|nr:hypothetical protein [Bradyrhizobium sp. KB893862 SZCCT0404]MBR1173895.1 hypothetical protein [Bradyrhizobium sp. KB893862 SZCCT0404]
MSNPFINLLLSRYDSGGGVQFAGNGMDDLKGLTDALAAYKKAAGPDEPKKDDSPKVAPIDRIKAAFEDLRNMHRTSDASAPQTYGMAPGSPAPPLPTGTVTPAPIFNGLMAQDSAPAAPRVPMPQPRPAEADAQQPALMSFFQRNAAMMKDPSTGDYIDPQGAAKAGTQAGIFDRLFG